MDVRYSAIINIIIMILMIKNSSGILPFLCSPREPANFQVNFYISTRSNLDQDYTLDANKNLTAFDFSPDRNTAVIVHGFLMNYKAKPIINMKNAFLQSENMNVITVDWSRGCNKVYDYIQAAANTQTVALEIMKFIVLLIYSLKQTTPTSKWGQFHFVGHSLGAHTVGQAAKLLESNNVSIHRVTGLDPAQPCFKDDNSPLRLKASNAHFVDVIHANGGGGMGIFEPIGHVDFYVNGGKKQPGCSDFDFKKFSFQHPTKYPMSVIFCHHNRAMSLFTQSLVQKVAKQCHFWSYPWNLKSNERYNQRISDDLCNENKCLEMGINAHDVNSQIKTFSVSTTGEEPYCNIY